MKNVIIKFFTDKTDERQGKTCFVDSFDCNACMHKKTCDKNLEFMDIDCRFARQIATGPYHATYAHNYPINTVTVHILADGEKSIRPIMDIVAQAKAQHTAHER